MSEGEMPDQMKQQEEARDDAAAASPSGVAEGEDVGATQGAPAPEGDPREGVLREEDVQEGDALSDREA